MKITRRTFIQGATTTALVTPFAGSAVASELEKINLVVTTSPPDPACHFYFYAKERGLYRDAGLDVDIKSVASPANVVRALLAGEADVVWVDAPSSLAARDSGAKLRGIGTFTPQVDFSIVATENIASIEQLPGKRFAIAAIGGSTYLLPKMMIERVGGDANSVRWVSLGSAPARAQALLAGTVDATIVATTFVPKLMGSAKNLKVLGTVSEALPDMLYAWNVATEDGLRRKKDQLQRFMRATSAAVKWAEANPADAAALTLQIVPTGDKEELTSSIRSYLERRYWSAEGSIPQAKFDFTVQSLKAAGLIKSDIRFEDFVERGLVG